MSDPSPPVLLARDLRRDYRLGLFGGRRRQALRGVDLEIRLGEVVGLAGESGSGKTTLVRCVLGLLSCEGERQLFGQDLRQVGTAGRRALSRKVQLMFQEPEALLNPALPLRAQLLESVRLHQPEAPPMPTVEDMARRVGLLHRLDARPGQLSGGEQRRASAARVMIADPILLVADEPTSGLDAALKADLIELLLRGRGPERAALLVSHDLPLLAWACGRILVMHAGRLVESLPTARLNKGKHHPYTAALLRASGLGVLRPRPSSPGPADLHTGCALAQACPIASAQCKRERPPMVELAPGHSMACHHAERL